MCAGERQRKILPSLVHCHGLCCAVSTEVPLPMYWYFTIEVDNSRRHRTASCRHATKTVSPQSCAQSPGPQGRRVGPALQPSRGKGGPPSTLASRVATGLLCTLLCSFLDIPSADFLRRRKLPKRQGPRNHQSPEFRLVDPELGPGSSGPCKERTRHQSNTRRPALHLA